MRLLLKGVTHFFAIYNDLGDKRVEVKGSHDADFTREHIIRSVKHFEDNKLTKYVRNLSKMGSEIRLPVVRFSVLSWIMLIGMLLGSMTFGGPRQGFAQTPGADVAAVRSYYEAGLKKNGILGSSLSIIRDGRVVLRDNYGIQSKSPDHAVDDDTTYHWASCTKTLTGIAIMQLRDRGLLSLDDPLIKYIPELAAVHDAYGSISEITIRHVMSHSGGFRGATWPWHDDDKPWQPFEPTGWSQIVAMLPYTDIAFKPGSKFSYSNLGVVFLGEIIERLSGDPYQVYMEKNVLRPLGMSRSYYDRSPYFLLRYRSHSWDLSAGKLTEDPFDFNTGITRSNGGLNAPMPDMLKYLAFLIGDPAQAAEYDVVLKRRSLEEMWKPLLPVIAPDEETRTGPGTQVATSFFVFSEGDLKLIGHTGSQNGFKSRFEIDPASRTGYIVVYNTDAYDETKTAAGQDTSRFDRELATFLGEHVFRKK